jgi:hypothetical protein
VRHPDARLGHARPIRRPERSILAVREVTGRAERLKQQRLTSSRSQVRHPLKNLMYGETVLPP